MKHGVCLFSLQAFLFMTFLCSVVPLLSVSLSFLFSYGLCESEARRDDHAVWSVLCIPAHRPLPWGSENHWGKQTHTHKISVCQYYWTICRYISIVHVLWYVQMLKQLLKVEKSALTGDLKWCKYILSVVFPVRCTNVWNKVWENVRYPPPLHIFVTSVW